MDFVSSIERYYFKNYHLLEKSKQFHFASRLAAWDGNAVAREILKRRLDYLLPSKRPEEARSVIKTLLCKEPHTIRLARAQREPFLQKYPDFYGLQLAVFRVRHLKSIYGINVLEDLFSLCPLGKIDDLKRSLLQDEEALRFLSTYAVSFCYLTDLVLHDQQPAFSIQRLYELRRGYDLQDKTHVLLLLYLYTHCIISATNFYTQPITQAKDVYMRMLEDADEIISSRYPDISLDNKLEFLVCTRICGFRSRSEKNIYEECRQSLSSEGTFVIDRLNTATRPERQTFAKSEHRNVMLIMSCKPFLPCSDLVI